MPQESPPPKKHSMEIEHSGAGENDDTKEEIPTSSEIGNDVSTEQDSSEEDLKIIHLNDECLEKIFRHLNLIDLTNVAEANERLAASAKCVFAQAHQNHRLFWKSDGEIVQIPERHPLIDTRNFIIKCDIVAIIFKHFGKYMRKIKVFHALGSFRCRRNFDIVNLIAEHCSTLQELEFFGSTAFGVLRRNCKPFVRLEKLVFSEIIIRMSSVDYLNEMFPNIRSLEFYNVFYTFESFSLERHFPHLQHFGIFTFPYTKFDRQYISIINRIVDLNQQLRSLSVYDLKLGLNEFSMETMPHIMKLEIGGTHVFPKPPFNFGDLKSLKITYSNDNKPNNFEWRNLSAQLEQLEIVGFQLNERSVQVILQCSNLTSFTLMSFDEVNLKCVEQLAENLTHIEKVEFISRFKENSQKTNAFAAALIFIKKGNSLRTATATIQVDKTDARFKTNKWFFTKENEFLESYRQQLEKTLIFNWWRWSLKHEVKIIDYLKGWQRGPVFSVSMINSHN